MRRKAELRTALVSVKERDKKSRLNQLDLSFFFLEQLWTSLNIEKQTVSLRFFCKRAVKISHTFPWQIWILNFRNSISEIDMQRIRFVLRFTRGILTGFKLEISTSNCTLKTVFSKHNSIGVETADGQLGPHLALVPKSAGIL